MHTHTHIHTYTDSWLKCLPCLQAVLLEIVLPRDCNLQLSASNITGSMSIVKPRELLPKKGRGLAIIGTLHFKQMKNINGKEVIECHLVCDDGIMADDIIFCEGWVAQGAKLNNRTNLDVVKITNPEVKALGDKAKYQLSSLQIYVHIAQMTLVEHLSGPAVPSGMPIVVVPSLPLNCMSTLKKKTHQFNVMGIVINIVPCTRANGPQKHFELIDDVKVRVSVWEQCAPAFVHIQENQVIQVTRVQASEGKDDSTELQTTRYSTFEVLTGSIADAVRQRNPTPTSALSLSHDYSVRTDYATVEAETVNLANLQNILVPGYMREIPTIFEVEHCLVRSFDPLGGGDVVYYLGCPQCKKGMTENCPVHNNAPVPMFLGMFQISDVFAETSAKAIGDVCMQVLQIDAEGAVPNTEGITRRLDEAIEKAMVTPMVMRFTVTKYTDKQKNQIELVHAKPSIDLVSGSTHLTLSPMRLAPIMSPGIPPVLIQELTMKDGAIMYRDAPVGTVQVFITLCDQGTETGCLQQHGNLVRVTRSVMCCVQGTVAKIRRTGTLDDMVSWLRLADKDYLYAVVTPIEKLGDTWHLAIVACQIWKEENTAGLFNTYWQQLLEVYSQTMQRETIMLDKSWTPLKRHKRLREEEGSSNASTPARTLTPSPMKFGQP